MVRLSWAARLAAMKALEPLDAMIAGWAGTQRHLRQHLEDQPGRRRQAVLPAAAIRGDLPLLPAGPVPAGRPAAAEDLRRVPAPRRRRSPRATSPASACAAAPAASTIGGRSCSAAAPASRRAAWSPRRRSPPTAGTSISPASDKVVPASAPTDSFRQIVDGFKAGRTAMIIHHVGSANEIVGALGDKVSAVPVPRAAGRQGLDLFRRRIERGLRREQGQGGGLQVDRVPVDGREQRRAEQAHRPAADHDLRRARTGPGIPSASSRRAPPRCRSPHRCPTSPKTPDFIARVWPTNMQRALTGEISPDDMMKAIEQHFNG